jgi:AcrR family transcriptional regulator
MLRQRVSLKSEIKELATRFLIRQGYRGLRFSDISEALQMTRANIHYHFGTKDQLVEEIICDYADSVVDVLTEIWSSDDYYTNKVLATMEFNRSRYLALNPTGEANGPWSLISRMRLESDMLSPTSRERLHRFSAQVDALIEAAIAKACTAEEFTKNAPVKDIQLQIVIIIDSAGSITMDAGSFTRLEQLYLAHLRLVSLGYGGPRSSVRADNVTEPQQVPSAS